MNTELNVKLTLFSFNVQWVMDTQMSSKKLLIAFLKNASAKISIPDRQLSSPRIVLSRQAFLGQRDNCAVSRLKNEQQAFRVNTSASALRSVACFK